jgi:hypothetical protein
MTQARENLDGAGVGKISDLPAQVRDLRYALRFLPAFPALIANRDDAGA